MNDNIQKYVSLSKINVQSLLTNFALIPILYEVALNKADVI